MKKIIYIACVLFLFFNCNGKNENQKKMYLEPDSIDNNTFDGIELKYPGVVIILPDSIEFLKGSMLVQNEKGNIINQISFDEEERVVKFEKGTPEIREYYPDYSIIIFDGYPLENGNYKVIIDDSVCYLKQLNGYTIFEKWEEHIKRTFINTDEQNPLRISSFDTSEIISNLNYDDLNFVVLSVKNDWVNVECDINCEGCPEGQLIKGWIRWRKDNKLLVKLYYVC
jgi:hypothetical protein